MIKPVLKEESFLRNVQISARSGDHLNLWWLGQSGFLVQWRGEHLLFDPYLSDSLTSKYAGTERPHVRMTELIVDPHTLTFIDVITSSHRHTDHLDPETLHPILQASPQASLVIPEANRTFTAQRLGCDVEFPVGLDDDTSVQIGSITLTGIPAAHEVVEQDEEGRCLALGYVAQMGPWTIYHSGDTVDYEGLEERLRKFDIDLALLPINGRDPARGVAGNLDGMEAARLSARIGARMVIPCHFEMFEFNTSTPEEFIRECRRLDQPYRVLRCGERWNDQEITEITTVDDDELPADRAGGKNRSKYGAGEDY
jgi:L-ascorbate metabolism protein UlaG (beta-lactamase superfamily)